MSTVFSAAAWYGLACVACGSSAASGEVLVVDEAPPGELIGLCRPVKHQSSIQEVCKCHRHQLQVILRCSYQTVKRVVPCIRVVPCTPSLQSESRWPVAQCSRPCDVLKAKAAAQLPSQTTSSNQLRVLVYLDMCPTSCCSDFPFISQLKCFLLCSHTKRLQAICMHSTMKPVT